MKVLKFLLLLVVVSLAVSCKNEKTDIKALVDEFANLECRAMTLREQRFELANQLRFTQDSLLLKGNKADTIGLNLKLATLNKQKEAMLKQSLSLADSIRTTLTGLMKNQLVTENDKQTFNEMLNKTLVERGCIKKTS